CLRDRRSASCTHRSDGREQCGALSRYPGERRDRGGCRGEVCEVGRGPYGEVAVSARRSCCSPTVGCTRKGAGRRTLSLGRDRGDVRETVRGTHQEQE